MDGNDIAQAMRDHGGSFVCALGIAWQRADPVNREKIERTWTDEWAAYSVWARRDQERRDGSGKDGGTV